MGNLWNIHQPDRNWNEHSVINGTLSDSLALPVIRCPACGEGWSSGRKLPFECPIELSERIREQSDKMKSRNTQGPFVSIQYDEFRYYAANWETALKKYDHDIILQPGDAFAPRLWRVPSVPRFDVFWPQPHEPVVSSRLRDLLEAACVSGIEFRPVVLDRDGSAEEAELAQAPGDADTSDRLDGFSRGRTPLECGTFFEMNLKNFSEPRMPEDGVKLISKCTTCGRTTTMESIEYKKQKNYCRKKKILPAAYTFNCDIFWSHIFYEGLIVSDRVRTVVADKYDENCRVTQLTVIDGAFGNSGGFGL